MTEKTTQPTAIESRKAEVEAYAHNIANYQNVLATLDGNWDTDLAHLKDVEVQEAARQCPMDRLERLGQLQLHKQIQNLLKTEIVEKTKAQIILDSITK
jgi:hypothetical protein